MASTPASSQLISGKQDSGSQLHGEEPLEVSSKSVKAAHKDTAKKSKQIPALAHDIELRNRRILMDRQNKVTDYLPIPLETFDYMWQQCKRLMCLISIVNAKLQATKRMKALALEE